MEIERTIRLKGRRGLEIAYVQSMTDFRQHELATNVKVQQPVEEASKIGSVLDKFTEGADTEVDVDRGNNESSHVPGSNHLFYQYVTSTLVDTVRLTVKVEIPKLFCQVTDIVDGKAYTVLAIIPSDLAA